MTPNQEKCVPDEKAYLSDPPQYKCKSCGRFWFTSDEYPICRPVEINTIFSHQMKCCIDCIDHSVDDKDFFGYPACTCHTQLPANPVETSSKLAEEEKQ